MSLKTKVKAGNITNLSDARYCAGMGVEWLSFPADVVNPITFKEITDWVAGPQFVLEVTGATTEDAIRQYPVTSLEIGLDQMPLMDHFPFVEWFVRFPASVWTTQKNTLLKRRDKISYIVLEIDHQDISVVKEIASYFKILIHQSDTLSVDVMLALPIEGINVIGEDELKPGLKDFDKLAAILEELEEID